METKRFFLWMFLMFLAFSGCEAEKKEEPLVSQKSQMIERPKRVIVVAIDFSGSYKLLNQAKDMLCWIIEKLRPGDILYCRAITDSSYLDNCSIFRLEIPALKEYHDDNPFDRKSKNQRSRELFQINMMKKEACNKLSVSPFTKVMKTDVYGFLAAASDKFALIPYGYQRILIIASDLQDNIGYDVKPQLARVNVAITGFQNDKDPSKTLKFKSRWVKYLSEAGAAKIVFLAIEDDFTMNHFLGGPQ